MPQAYQRTDRVSEEVRRSLDHLLRHAVHDPRIAGTFSVTRVDVVRDLRYAKVRVSVLEEPLRAPFLKALKSASGFLRRELGKTLGVRYTPELLFELDDNIEYGAHIAQVLRAVTPPAEALDLGVDSDSDMTVDGPDWVEDAPDGLDDEES